MTTGTVTNLSQARGIDRAQIHANMEKIIEELKEFYIDDEDRLAKEIEQVRRGDPGAVGDKSVIIWGAGQLAFFRSIKD